MAATIVTEDSRNRKIAGKGHVAATYASTAATCPSACPLKDAGCYAETGRTGIHVSRMNRDAVGLSDTEIAIQEAHGIDRAFRGRSIPQDGAKGGRDLRVHVSGDARTPMAAATIAAAARRWAERGGGAVWSYTHAWRDVARPSWAGVSVLASMEDPKDAAAAAAQGYAPALVVASHDSEKAHTLPGSSVQWIPCPEQTRGIPCSDCRLCMNADRLLATGKGIAFAVHGAGAKKAKRHLTVSK